MSVLNYAPHYDGRSTAPRIINLSLDETEYLASPPTRFILARKSPRYSLTMILSGPQSRSGYCEEVKNLLLFKSNGMCRCGKQFIRLAGPQCLHLGGQAVQPDDKGIRSFGTSGTTHPTIEGHIPRGLNFQQRSIIRLQKSVTDPLLVCCLVDNLITIPTELLVTAYFTYLFIS